MQDGGGLVGDPNPRAEPALVIPDQGAQVLPVMVYVEGTIYHIDEANEHAPPLAGGEALQARKKSLVKEPCVAE